MKPLRPLFFGLIAFLWLSGCYYDKEAELYPDSANCDTSNVTYSGVIKPLLEQNCVSCHNQAIPNGQVVLDNYDSVASVAANGKLYGSISHASGYSAMPQGAPKLSDCSILKVKVWIDDNYPNN